MPSREFEIENDDSLEVEPIASTISLIAGNAFLVFVIAVMVAVICNTHPDYTHRFDCGPDRDGVDKATCERRGCIWSWPITSNPPACFFPPNGYITYNMTDISPYPWGYRVQLRKRTEMPDFFDGGLETLWIDVELQTRYRLHIKIYDPEDKRFEVPISLPPPALIAADDPLYNVSVTEEPFSFQVIRTDTNTVVFDTSVGVMIFEDQFLQLSTKLPSHNIYGFGEHAHDDFRRDLNWKRWGSFARDQKTEDTANLYGTHPFYLCLENDSNAHGVFLNNANGQDVSFQPNPALTYRHIGGVFDFYMFFGPTPENVISQYTEAIGRPYFPPYWALGFHLSKYGYNSLDKVKEVVARMRMYNIPHDVQYGDIDYMDRKRDFTIDDQRYGEVAFKDFVKKIKEEGTKYIVVLDPAIAANETTGTYRPYDDGVEKNVFIHDENGEIIYGKVWPVYPGLRIDDSKPWDYQIKTYRGYVAFPDFQRKQTKEWWIREVVDFHDKIDFDAIWIDMTEPANFLDGSVNGCSINKYDYPPYHPHILGETMADQTLCMSAIQNLDESNMTIHYNMHNLYGWSQTMATLRAARAATGKRSLVINRSTYPGSGKYSGHWLGDNFSLWLHMRRSIIGILDFNLFGIPFVGADICGLFLDVTEPLCRRWSQLGNFYTFSRNHNGLIYRDQDPAAFGREYAEEMKKLLAIRYTLLPYLYTLQYKATAYGHTVTRPLMFEFTSDSETWGIDRQFLWGPGFMIVPVLEEGAISVNAYIPKARWYDWYTGREIDRENTGRWINIPASDYHIPLYIRGGHILPTQQPANSTKFSRKHPFGLIVALNDSQSAVGTLFWDDGTSVDTIENGEYYKIEYVVCQSNLTANISNSYGTLLDNLRLDTVKFHGLITSPSEVKLNDVALNDSQWTFNDVTKTLSITDLQHPMSEQFLLAWH